MTEINKEFIKMAELHVSINRHAFSWGNDSSDAVKAFFKLEKERKEIFSNKNLAEMVNFYTNDNALRIYELDCVIEKNNQKLDIHVSMFIEGEKACHRISFYMNDYEGRKKGPAGETKARQMLKYTLYQAAKEISIRKASQEASKNAHTELCNGCINSIHVRNGIYTICN